MITSLKVQRQPKDDYTNFQPNERVRIYSGHTSGSAIEIREGVVIDYRLNQGPEQTPGKQEKEFILIRVEARGKLGRARPKNIRFYNPLREEWVEGNIRGVTKVKPYEAQLKLELICAAERLLPGI